MRTRPVDPARSLLCTGPAGVPSARCVSMCDTPSALGKTQLLVQVCGSSSGKRPLREFMDHQGQGETMTCLCSTDRHRAQRRTAGREPQCKSLSLWMVTGQTQLSLHS